jgi:hypothetical protein
MTIKSLQSTSLTNNIFYRSMLAGNDAFFPEFESDDFLEEVVLTTSASSVTFSGLGAYSDYKHLQIRMVGRAIEPFNATNSWIVVNNDTGANYASHNLRGNGSGVFSGSATSGTRGYLGFIASADASTDWYGAKVIDILDFSSNTKKTTVRTFTGIAGIAGTYSATYEVGLFSNLWNNTDAVTSLRLETSNSSYGAGSRFSLYGSKG